MDRIDYEVKRRRAVRALLLVLSVPVWAGCDFKVTNPGPVQDEQLNNTAAMQALVSGAGRTVSFALGWMHMASGIAVKEIIGSGNITQFGVTLKQRAGILAPENQEMDQHWTYTQRARWVSEESVRRLRTILGSAFSTDARSAQALLYVGYANRLLGENMCDAVIDGGAKQARSVYMDRAKAAFTEAIAVGGAAAKPDYVTAGKAGRASVEAWLNDWTGAMADATGIASSFRFDALYYNNDLTQYNYIFWGGNSQPFRTVSLWSTWFDQHYTDTKDPRTPWALFPGQPTGDGSQIIFHQQRKFTAITSPVRLSSGSEMRLILAEGKLRAGDFAGATTILNQLRADATLPAEVTTNAVETWNMLRRERASELWLEARSLGDVWRWKRDNVPGTHFQDLTGRDLCFPIGQTEVDTNTNF